MTRLFTHNDNGDVAITDSGTITVDTSRKWEGVDSIRPDTALAYRERTQLTTVGQAQFVRLYAYIDEYPSANSAIAVVINTGGAVVFRLYVTTTGTVRLVDSTGGFIGNTSSPLNLDAWNILEVKYQQNATAANGTIANKVNGIQVTPDTTVNLTNTAANRLRWGRPTTNTTWTNPPNIDAVVQNNDQGGAPDNTYVGGTIPPGAPAQLRPSGNQRRPVIPVGMVDINNVTMANANDRLMLRMVLDVATDVQRVWFGWRMSGVTKDGSGATLTGALATELSTGAGYGGGNGGSQRFDLYAIGSDGKPTGSPLFTETGINAVDRYAAIKTLCGFGTAHMLMYAQFAAGSLAAGEYGLVVRNVDASPNVNFSSVNCPVTSLASAGPHAANTRSNAAAGAIAGLDPRESLAWSIDAGTHWYWGQPVGGETIAHGITNGEHRAGGDSRYYVSTGDDEVRLPWFAIANAAGVIETYQPYYGSNTTATNQTLTATNAGRAVTLTHAGAFAKAGGSVGTITVTNLNTGEVRTCTPSGTGGKREAALSATLDVGAGETITINPSGTVCLEEADAFQTDADSYGLGSGDNPFNTSGSGAWRLGAYVLPWPYFAAPGPLLLSVDDALGLDDAVTPVATGGALTRTINDPLGATDALALARAQTTADPLGLTDVLSPVFGTSEPAFVRQLGSWLSPPVGGTPHDFDVTVTAATALGNKIIVYGKAGTGTEAVTAVTDDRGNSYTVHADSTLHQGGFVASAICSTALQIGDKVHIFRPGPSGFAAYALVSEWRNVGAFDAAAYATFGSTALVGGSLSPAVAGELMIGMFYAQTAAPTNNHCEIATPGASYTNMTGASRDADSVNGFVGVALDHEYAVLPSTASAQASATGSIAPTSGLGLSIVFRPLTALSLSIGDLLGLTDSPSASRSWTYNIADLLALADAAAVAGPTVLAINDLLLLSDAFVVPSLSGLTASEARHRQRVALPDTPEVNSPWERVLTYAIGPYDGSIAAFPGFDLSDEAALGGGFFTTADVRLQRWLEESGFVHV